jgi:ABC-type nitrate/sulfonate/bicarbonate transport system substrate-binding protein
METVRLGLEWFLNPDHVPFFVADERGYYADEGVALEVVEPADHHETMDELADGETDLAVTEPLHLVVERSEGVPVVGVGSFLDARGGIQYPVGRGWESPADLEPGVRLNYPGAPGPGGRRMVARMVREAGGDLTAEEIHPVDRGFYHTDALVEGDADVAFLAFHNFEVVESRHRGVETAVWELSEYGLPDFARLTLAATEETLDRRPESVEAFLRATARGLEDTVEEGRPAAEALFDRHPHLREEDPDLVEAVTAATVERFESSLDQDPERYRDLVAFCETEELTDGPVSAEDCLREPPY